ncbi:MAG TPA: FAD-dependent oxidoreductase [Gaiellaceae bacterium]|nr:FAD-dependent oxidoreductase [Gaiellaceae bacterium]
MDTPYWLQEEIPRRPQPRHDGHVDVAIVGAGVTGCSAALRLAEAGVRVRVHESRRVAEGASGRNGGFALTGGATLYDVARDTYGREEACELWRWTERALERMFVLGGDSLRRTGSYRLATDEEEREQIRREYDALREDGFDAEWLDEVPGPVGGLFLGAVHHPHDATIQPARFVRRLAAHAAEAGADIREHDEVADVDALDADHVVVATDGYGHGLVPELADLIWPARGQMIACEPLDRVLFDRPHYARQGFDYWQQLADGRVLLGGFRDVSIMDELTDVEETTPAIQASLEQFLGELIGRPPQITHRWAGIFGLTQDLLPLAGRVPGLEAPPAEPATPGGETPTPSASVGRGRIWVAAGYSGHGNIPGFACGELVADAILGDVSSPQLELLDPARFSG